MRKMARSGWRLLGLTIVFVWATSSLVAAHNCQLERILGNEQFAITCGYTNKQLEAVVHCTDLSDDSWLNFPEDKLDLWNVATMKFNNCQVPESLSLRDIVSSLNVSFIDTLHFENLQSALSRQNLRGFSIRVLKIIRANFHELPSDLLYDVSDLKSLRIEETKLTSIPPNFFKDWSSKLQNVSFLNNTLQSIGRHDLEHLEEAQNIWLTYNQISEIEVGAFDRLPNLRSLDIASNRLRTLSADLFRRLGNVEGIHVGSNQFDELPADLLTNIEDCHLERFRMSYNNGSLTSLPQGFFRNLSRLSFVELLHNEFTSLPKDLFAGAYSLKHLNISENNLTTLPSGLFEDTRKLLDLRIINNQLEYLPEGIFRELTSLERLYLNQNHLTNISSNILEGLVSLKVLQAAWNNLTYIDKNFCQYVKEIRDIDLMGNQLTLEKLPRISILLNCMFVRELMVSYNKIPVIYSDWVQSTNMELLDLQFNEITEFGTRQLNILHPEVTIYLQNNKITTIDLRELENETETYRSNNIEVPNKGIKVYLGSNPLNCDCHLIDFFRYFENKLNKNVKSYVEIYADFDKTNIGFEGFRCVSPPELAHRNIIDIKSEDLSCLVKSDLKSDACSETCVCRDYPDRKRLSVDCSHRNLTKLPAFIANPHNWSIELNMSNNMLRETPSLNSPHLANVVSLDLSSNNISTVTIDVFSKSLVDLKLHNNSISRLDNQVIDYLIEDKALNKLTLHKNNWECNCGAHKFLTFVQKKLTTHELHEIMCFGTNHALSSMTVSELCKDGILILVVSCLVATFFLGILVAGSVALYYRFKKKIKIWLYSKQLCLWFVTEEEVDKDKKYDAFISFSHKDEDFVEKEIVTKLEDGPNPYKLCLHYRDWLAGEWIPVQISDSVENSRRTIVILSASFIESEWGRMEFRAAHSHALKEGSYRLIVVLYGDIGNIDDLDPELKSYLNSNTYVKWGDPWFWDKLRYALPHRHESSKRRSRNARIIENHLAQLPVNNPSSTATTGKAEVIPMPKLTTSTNDSVKLLDSASDDDRMVASC